MNEARHLSPVRVSFFPRRRFRHYYTHTHTQYKPRTFTPHVAVRWSHSPRALWFQSNINALCHMCSCAAANVCAARRTVHFNLQHFVTYVCARPRVRNVFCMCVCVFVCRWWLPKAETQSARGERSPYGRIIHMKSDCAIMTPPPWLGSGRVVTVKAPARGAREKNGIYINSL